MNRLFFRTFNPAIFLFFSTFVSAQDTSSRKLDTTYSRQAYHFNLNDCLQYAYIHQKAMANSSLDVEIAKAKVKETTGIGLPQITASGQFLYFPEVASVIFPDFITPLVTYALNSNQVANSKTGQVIPVQSGGASQAVKLSLTHTAYGSVDLSQILFDGTYLVGLQASKVFRELSTKSLKQTKIQTALAVSKAYYNTLVGKEQLKVLDADIKRVEKNYSDTKALNQNGLVEKIDLSRVELQLNILLTQRIKAQRTQDLGVYALKYQMGMPLENPLFLDSLDKVAGSIQLPEVADTNSLDPKNRIEYSLQSTQVHLNLLDLKRYRFANLPTLTAIGEYRISLQNNSYVKLLNTIYPQAFIGLNLNVPVFSGFQRSNRIKEAKFTLRKSENDLKDLGVALKLDLRNSRTTYQNSLDDFKTQEKNQDLAKEIYRVTKIKYEQGIGSSLELNTAEQDLKTAETNYLSSLYNALISKVDLDKSMGILIIN